MVTTFEELMDELDDTCFDADNNVGDWQGDIKKGDCFWRDHPCGIRIIGEVLKIYKSSVLRGYMFCKCHSTVMPRGEMGDVHRSVIGGLLTKEEYLMEVKKLNGK